MGVDIVQNDLDMDRISGWIGWGGGGCCRNLVFASFFVSLL